MNNQSFVYRQFDGDWYLIPSHRTPNFTRLTSSIDRVKEKASEVDTDQPLGNAIKESTLLELQDYEEEFREEFGDYRADPTEKLVQPMEL